MRKFSPAQLAAQERFRQMVKSGAWPKRKRLKGPNRWLAAKQAEERAQSRSARAVMRNPRKRRTYRGLPVREWHVKVGRGGAILARAKLNPRDAAAWNEDARAEGLPVRWVLESARQSNPRKPLPEAWAAHKAKRKKQWAAYWGKKRQGNPDYTSEGHVVLNRWARSGPEAFVSKVRGGWLVEVGGHRTPKVFRSKASAMSHADASVSAFLDRQRTNPTLMVLEGAAAANPIRNPRVSRRTRRHLSTYASKSRLRAWAGRQSDQDIRDLLRPPNVKSKGTRHLYAAIRREKTRRHLRTSASEYRLKRRPNPTVPGAALKMYRRFHGTDPMSVIRAPDQPGAPKYVVALGRLKDVSYQVPGHSKKAGRRNIPYKHISGRGNLLCTDASGRNLYIVKTRASRMRVRSNGIHD